MFDNLTLGDLYCLHADLCDQYHAQWDKIMVIDPDDPCNSKPTVSVLSDEWNLVSAMLDDISATTDAVYAEITRRELELVDDDA